jgi:pimeloyl-ACP methyl ester carboxylesterase
MTSAAGLPAQDRYAAWDVPVPGGLLRVGGWEAVAAQGASPLPVLAVHGVTASHLTWVRLAAQLPGRSVMAPDLRGRGHSNSVPGPFGMATHADDFARALDDRGWDRALVVGHSMGGFASTVLADRHPDRVAALVLVDGGLPLRVPEGLSPDEVAKAVLGPTLARLGMTFADHAAYQGFWQRQPAFARDWDEVVAAYVDYDLQGEEPQLRPRTTTEAVAADNVDMLTGGAVMGAVERLRHPTWFLRSPRGLQDEVPPLYPDALATDWQHRLPDVRMSTVDDVNHYTIVLADRGAAAVAAAVEEAAAMAERGR